MEGKPLFYENEKNAIQKEISLEEDATLCGKWDGKVNFEEFYEIDDTIECIQKHNFKKIALQFPDEILSDSTRIASLLKNKTNGVEFYILGDTSYGKCCVDEVAAEHVNADLVIHYGTACLSKTSRLPVLYRWGRFPLNTSECSSHLLQLAKELSRSSEEGGKIHIWADLSVAHAIPSLKELLLHEPSLSFADVPSPLQWPVGRDRTVGSVGNSSQESGKCSSCECRSESKECGQSESDTKDTSVEPSGTLGTLGATTQDAPLGSVGKQKKITFCGRSVADELTIANVFLGTEGATLTTLLLTFPKLPHWTFHPLNGTFRQETFQVNRALQRRYFLVQKAKDAEVVGVVVGTLGMAHYMEAVDHLKQILKNAGKKVYTFVVGKVNIPKLANFEVVELFVVVACPFTSFFDSREFFKPVITPFELEIALVKGKEWTGDFSTDFSSILPGLQGPTVPTSLTSEEEEEEVRFSFLTGSMKLNPKASQPLPTDAPTTHLISREDRIQEWSPSGKQLQSRTFKGLDPLVGQTPITLAVPGTRGIAKGYDREVERLEPSLSSPSSLSDHSEASHE